MEEQRVCGQGFEGIFLSNGLKVRGGWRKL
jgi:hypothetical protein